MAQRHLGVSDM